MLKPAILYKEELERKMGETFYNLDYENYYGVFNSVVEIESNTKDWHSFASVGQSGEVIGFVRYRVDYSVMSASDFSIISFLPKGKNVEFVADVKQAIDNLFTKFGFNRLEWIVWNNGTLLNSYRKLAKRIGGREVGTLRSCVKLLSGKVTDCVVFEVLKKDYERERKKEQTKPKEEFFVHFEEPVYAFSSYESDILEDWQKEHELVCKKPKFTCYYSKKMKKCKCACGQEICFYRNGTMLTKGEK